MAIVKKLNGHGDGVSTVANYIQQVRAGDVVYDIATHHGISFKEGNNGEATVWYGLEDIEITIPTLTDLIQDPIRFAGTVGSDGKVVNDGKEVTPAKGDLVYITADCTFAGIACEAGDMAVYDGSWHVVSGENQVSIITTDGTEDGNTTTVKVGSTAASVLSVEGKYLKLSLKEEDIVSIINSNVKVDKNAVSGTATGDVTLNITTILTDFVSGLAELGTGETADVVTGLTVTDNDTNTEATSNAVMATAKVNNHVLSFGTVTLGTTGKKLTKGGYTAAFSNGTVSIDSDTVVTDVYAGSTTAAGKSGPVYEYVDLGLRVKWATMNIGAEKETDYGNYYAWGETETKETYSWSNYKYGTSSTTLTKYNTKSSNGTVDNKTTLEASDDAASVNWGGDWRMPTPAEFQELIDGTNSEWSTIDGINGRKFTKTDDSSKSIFIPASGYRSDSSLGGVGNSFRLWSGSLDGDNPFYGIYLYSYSGSSSLYDGYRYYGFAVRPVLY